jgi:spore coat protein U-like protein
VVDRISTIVAQNRSNVAQIGGTGAPVGELGPMTLGRGWIAAAALLLALPAAPCAAAPATQSVTVSAKIVKPLTLTWEQDLDMGSILLAPGVWSGATVALSQDGQLACGDARVTCSGMTAVARYRVTGTNRQVVRITAPDVVMVNQADPTKTLLLRVDSPDSVTLTSSGAPGNIFSLGGAITLDSTTADGTYTGTFDVTVDY